MRSGLLLALISFLLLWSVYGLAESADYEAACEQECSYLTKSCTTYMECMVAKTQCRESCMQRKVWEKVATAVDKLTTVLEKQAKEESENKDHAEPYTSGPLSPSQNATESKPYKLDSLKSNSTD